MVTRGVKRTPYQDPRVTIGPATVVIIPEYKLPKPEVVAERHHALHRACAAHRAGRAGPEAQLAFEAELHPRLHPGDEGRRRRGADARSRRLRRDLQLDAFLHRAERRGVDLAAGILPGRHHARQRARRGARGRHSGVREALLADRRLRRRRSFRHRHVRRPGAGAQCRRAHDRRSGSRRPAGDEAPRDALQGADACVR